MSEKLAVIDADQKVWYGALKVFQEVVGWWQIGPLEANYTRRIYVRQDNYMYIYIYIQLNISRQMDRRENTWK